MTISGLDVSLCHSNSFPRSVQRPGTVLPDFRSYMKQIKAAVPLYCRPKRHYVCWFCSGTSHRHVVTGTADPFQRVRVRSATATTRIESVYLSYKRRRLLTLKGRLIDCAARHVLWELAARLAHIFNYNMLIAGGMNWIRASELQRDLFTPAVNATVMNGFETREVGGKNSGGGLPPRGSVSGTF